MIRGLYNGAAALDVITKQQELISSNLANLNSSGHRRGQFAVIQRENPQPGSFVTERGPRVIEQHTDFSNGRLHSTGRPLDVALMGDGFFTFETPSGPVYSRGGQFYRDADSGTLVNSEGQTVLGETGAIRIPPEVGDRDILIGEDGNIVGRDGQQFGKLAITAFENNQTLERISQSIFRASGNSVQKDESTAIVNQYHQEYSNGHPVSEMISMIIGMRQYEAVQKAETAMSESLREHIRA